MCRCRSRRIASGKCCKGAFLRSFFESILGRNKTETKVSRKRGACTHVIILDGTMSTLYPGCETHAGQLYKLLCEAGASASLTVHYEPGIQWHSWRETLDVMNGRGINRQIVRAYGALASRYRTGDRIVLVGYSRGAYAVRSLAGVIDLVGLVRADEATQRNIKLAYRHYRRGGTDVAAKPFCDQKCHTAIEIEAVAVWDTVKALGVRLPLLWRFSEVKNAFHNDALGNTIKNGFHALALDETREAYVPVLWTCPPGWEGNIEQVWFSGTHGDVGGQLNGYNAARPLANISLVWMFKRLEGLGLPLPDGWKDRYDINPKAPSLGRWRGWAKVFLSRKRRIVGRDISETIHPSVFERDPTVSPIG